MMRDQEVSGQTVRNLVHKVRGINGVINDVESSES